VAAAQPRSPLDEAAFVPLSADADPIGRLVEREGYAPGQGPVRWKTGAVQLSKPATHGPVDSLRVSVGGALQAPGGLPLDLSRAQFDSRAYEVSLVRDWPGAVSFDAGRFDVDVSPHAGVGVTSYGGSAEAGATLRLSQRLDETAASRLKSLGVRDGAAFGDRGRWYLFAAAGARAVGLNMLRSDLGWDRAGWTTDPTSALIGDAQLGVGWRKGPLQSSLGLVHREVKGQHMLFGQQTHDDTLVAFSLSIKPQK
jgi:hypothetical protein